MREAQRALGLEGGVVEGRDIATVVFPDAPVKLYLVADPAKRIERRARQRDGRERRGRRRPRAPRRARREA